MTIGEAGPGRRVAVSEDSAGGTRPARPPKKAQFTTGGESRRQLKSPSRPSLSIVQQLLDDR